MSPVLVVSSSLFLVLVALLIRNPRLREGSVPFPLFAAVLVSVAGIVVGGLISPRSTALPTVSAATDSSGPAPATGQALGVGEPAPAISVQGWVNGPPAKNRKVTVIDVWAPWCLVCHEMAPGMVRLHEEYARRGVEFVSLTDMSKDAVAGFVGHFDIPWASGYGAPKKTVADFRALRQAVEVAERRIAPTLYVVDAAGTVLWTDDAGRYRHEQVDDLLTELSSQLDRALASSGSPRESRSGLARAFRQSMAGFHPPVFRP